MSESTDQAFVRIMRAMPLRPRVKAAFDRICPPDVQSPMSRRRDLNTEVAESAGESTVGESS